MIALVLVAVAYGLGALPFGLWLTRLEGLDLRASGSGNIGATNVWRTAGRSMAVVVLTLDVAKGTLGVLLARLVVDDPWVMAACAIAAVSGHVWPVWAEFRGGKGVATAAGAFAALVPESVVWTVMVFGCVVAITRYVSVASIVAAVCLPAVAWFIDGRMPVAVGAGIVAAVVVWRHAPNVSRLMRGVEPRVGARTMDGRRRAPFAG